MNAGLGIWNYGNYSNPQVDALYALMMRTLDPTTRKNYVQEAIALIMQDVACVPLYSSKAFYGVQQDILWDPRPSMYILVDEISFKK